MMQHHSTYWIQKLGLQKHPEGGYYKEVYRSDETIPQALLPIRFKGDRCFSTSIYFLLESDSFSAFHRIQSEEIWHFYKGTSLTLYVITDDGCLTLMQLGDNIDDNEFLQIVIPRNVWFAAKVNAKNSFTLVGCTVAPGFDFTDFELADCKKLCERFSQHEAVIKSLTLNH